MQPTLQDGTVIDPKVLKVMKAIKSVEGGDYNNYTGDNGSSAGAFQWNNNKIKLQPGQLPARFLEHAQEAGVQVNDFSPASQNKVAYSIMKKWKDEGLLPEEIAAKWNGASKDPTTGRLVYNAPEYGEKFRAALTGGQPQLQPQTSIQLPDAKPTGQATNMEQPEGKLAQLGTALGKRGDQIDSAIGRNISGEQGLASTGLQTVGAVAGGALDIAGAAVKAIPVVGDVIEAGEELLGKGVQSVLETPTGQQLLGEYQVWAEENPEAAANIAAGFNIASVLPVFKAFQTAGAGLNTAKTAVFNKGLQKAAQEELENSIMRTTTGMRQLTNSKGRGMNPAALLVRENALPDVVQDARGVSRYNTANAEQKLDDIIEKLDGKLDAELAAASAKISGYVPMEDLKKQVMDEVKKELKGSPDLKRHLDRVEDDFDSFKLSYGTDLLPLGEVNTLKRMVRKSVKFDTPDIDKNVRYHEGQVMMRIIEDVARKQGLGSVRNLNREMAERIDAEALLRKISNKSVTPEKPGVTSNPMVEGALVSGGEAVGQSFGAPLVGGIAGKSVSALLNRPKKSAVQKLSKSPSKKGLIGSKTTLGGLTLLGAQRGYQQEQERGKSQ
jgi:hypothetical protein